MSSTESVQRPFARVVAPVIVVALLAVLAAWQGGIGPAEGRSSAAGADGTTISVHGDWTIDVYAADGELVAQEAFRNALTDTGAIALSQVMSGHADLVRWSLAFECGYGFSAPDSICWIQTPDAMVIGPNTSDDLEVMYSEGEDGFVIQGTALAPQDFTLDRVWTYISRRPKADAFGRNSPFTGKVLPEPEQIEILEGQSIVIRVELSFS